MAGGEGLRFEPTLPAGRPESLFPLFAPVTSLKGVGPRVAPLLERIAGPRVRDLLFLKPQDLLIRSRATTATLQPGTVQTLLLRVDAHVRPARPGQPWRIRCTDEAGFVTLVFFHNQGRRLDLQHPLGAERAVSGKVEIDPYSGAPQIVHPDWLVAGERLGEIPDTETVYGATAGLTSRILRRLILEGLSRVPDLEEWIDPSLVAREKWPTWRAALLSLHAPTDARDLAAQTGARRRLAYDELLAHQVALHRRRRARRARPGPILPPGGLSAAALSALPFRLTAAQARVREEIGADLASGERMTRLLQGDVGSGKTVVAMLAMLDAASAGAQAALMAPTEILARQHYDTVAGPMAAQGVEATLLTGRDKGRGRAAKLAALREGSAGAVIGTHALFQADVAFSKLALAVIDEQHRFGVSERGKLLDKGIGVHLLAMSATPIPRTLELSLYGDLDVSRIDEKPPGRRPIATRAAPMQRLEEVIHRLAQALKDGAQAFWICPLVTESETSDLATAEARLRSLTTIFGDAVGLIHGRLPAAQKDQTMARFALGEIKLLVATTVVEVGVDVPSAEIMVIEQAERFGLAQLHQLRGRIGRGERDSSCVLLYDHPVSDIARRRLEILRRTEDGFVIAEEDLRLRGGGDPLGLRQSGFPAYRLADPISHGDLVEIAAKDASLIVDRASFMKPGRAAALAALEALFDWSTPIGLGLAG